LQPCPLFKVMEGKKESGRSFRHRLFCAALRQLATDIENKKEYKQRSYAMIKTEKFEEHCMEYEFSEIAMPKEETSG